MGRPRIFSDWFRIRKDLSPGRKTFLTIVSFCLPAALWCVVSYVPFIWHPDVKITVAASRDGSPTVLTAGDHLPKDYFPKYANDVREENASVREGSKRKNQKLLRQISPLVIDAGWLDDGDGQNDAKIYLLWRDLANGSRTLPALNEENMEIVRKNWAVLGSASPVFDYKALPETPLLKLVPQGVPANPVLSSRAARGDRDRLVASHHAPAKRRSDHGRALCQLAGHHFPRISLGLPAGCSCRDPLRDLQLFLDPVRAFHRFLPIHAGTHLQHPAGRGACCRRLSENRARIHRHAAAHDPDDLENHPPARSRPAGGRADSRRKARADDRAKWSCPASLPNLYNDLRILLGWAWTWLVIAELIGVKSGLTEVIETQGRFRNFDQVFPVIILIGVTGFVTDQILAWLHGILFPMGRDFRENFPCGSEFRHLAGPHGGRRSTGASDAGRTRSRGTPLCQTFP